MNSPKIKSTIIQFIPLSPLVLLFSHHNHYSFLSDLEGLKKQSEEGARFGFTGKQVIHPTQIGVVQEAFHPTPEKVVWARELIEEFRKHEREGHGAFTFRGHMIDRPLVLQAENVLKIAQCVEDNK